LEKFLFDLLLHPSHPLLRARSDILVVANVGFERLDAILRAAKLDRELMRGLDRALAISLRSCSSLVEAVDEGPTGPIQSVAIVTRGFCGRCEWEDGL